MNNKEDLQSKFQPTITYSGKQVNHLIEQHNFKEIRKPSEIKKGDIFITKDTNKNRPAVVIKVLKNRTVVYCHLTSTDNIHCMTSIKSRFSVKESCVSCGFSICTEEFAIENFVSVLDNMKAVNQAVKDLRVFFINNI